MKVKGVEVPEMALDAALRRMEKGEFEAFNIRAAMEGPIMRSNMVTRMQGYDMADAAATRLIATMAKRGLIRKVTGTRRWVMVHADFDAREA